MIALNWYTYLDSAPTSFTVYRSVPGFIIPFPNSLLTGAVLKFSATSCDTIQYVTLAATDINSVVATINTGALGLLATKNNAGNAIIVRLTATSHKARLELFDCTFLEQLSLLPSVIYPQMNFVSIASVAFVTNTTNYTFNDIDGSNLDSYYVTTTLSSTESIPSPMTKVLLQGYSYCIVETVFVDGLGRPIKGVEVTVSIAEVSDHDKTGLQAVTVKSDDFGRIALSLIQGIEYVLTIPAVSYNEIIKVPALPAVELSSLLGRSELHERW